jgi:hypothetical protein
MTIDSAIKIIFLLSGRKKEVKIDQNTPDYYLESQNLFTFSEEVFYLKLLECQNFFLISYLNFKIIKRPRY